MTLFEEYKIVHNFTYPDKPLKVWINEINFNNIFKKDWNMLMSVIEKIEELGYFCIINKWTAIYTGSKDERTSITTVENRSKIENTYKAILIFINWYNKNK